jgi:gliding motility-associated-like protein
VNFKANDTIGCTPVCVSFQDLSTIATGGQNTHWAWIVGDGSPVNSSENFDHCYTNTSVFSAAHYSVILTVTSDSGCVSSATKNNYITVFPNPDAIFTVDPQTASIINPVIDINDLSTGATAWKWNFGDTATSYNANPLSHTYADTGTYIIRLITSTTYGCYDTAYQTVIIDPDFEFYIPNAFTPNGDGKNDTFTGKGIFIKEYEMMIFDRWGNLIFYTDDLNKPWDGRANHGADMAQRDVYVYVVNLTDIKNKKHNYKGTVTLVR